MKSSLAIKMGAVFAILILLMGYLVTDSMRRSNAIAVEYDLIVGIQEAMITKVTKLQGTVFKQQASLNRHVATNEDISLEEYNKAEIEAAEITNEIDQLVDRMPKEVQAPYIDLINKVKEAEQGYKAYAASITELIDAGADSQSIAEHMGSVGDPVTEGLIKATDNLLKHTHDREQIRLSTAQATKHTSDSVQKVLFALSTVFAMVIASILTRSITKPVNSMTKVAQSLASGDLTREVPDITSNDEIGILARSFKEMTVSLRELVKQVSNTAESLASASEELAASAEQASSATTQIGQTISQIAVGAQQEVGAVHDTTASVDSVADAVDVIMKLSDNLTAAAHSNAASGQRGAKSSDNVTESMREVTDVVDLAMVRVRSLAKKSDEIESVVELISNIADQTNLLALNAAIESARAGEHGRGFAVVAEEVRKLAEKSQRSTKEIATLIDEIREDMDATVKAIEGGTNAVSNTAELVGETGMALREISESAQSAAQEMGNLSDAAYSINAAVVRVQSAMQTIAAITEETSASSEEVSAATEEQNASIDEVASSARNLSEMAQNLAALVAKFTI